jgi:hypothetical protein
MIPKILSRLGTLYLQQTTRPDAAQERVPIGCVLMYIYKSVLQTINIVVQTLSRMSELVATKYIINKVILDVRLLLFRWSELV